MKVMVVVGTRPEAIKMAPVIVGLRAAGVETLVVSTGQHARLTASALSAFGLVADRALPAIEGEEAELGGLLAKIVDRMATVIATDQPGAVLVHGDTVSTLGAGLAASCARVPVGHVEAGLRTNERSTPFPEELNRVLVDQLSTWWFAPTSVARSVLLREGHPADRVLMVGNPIVDAVRRIQRDVERTLCGDFPELAPLDLDGGEPVVLVTAHRRENLGPPLRRICAALKQLTVRVVWPVHPNPEIVELVQQELGSEAHVRLCGPLGYPAMVRLMLRAGLVLTDSGGIQEEAAILGRPTLVLRDVTERPEVLDGGVVRLVGTSTPAIVTAATNWLRRTPTQIADDSPLGDGRAGERIGRWFAGAFD